MIKAVVKFFGRVNDQHGMPDPYFSYLVVASPWQSNDSGIASIVPLTQSSGVSTSESAPVSLHHVKMVGGEKAAYEKAVKALKDAPHHKELHFHEHIA